jgi:hypothetical protein
MDEQLIRLRGTVIADVAATYVHNLTRTGMTTKRFGRSAVNDRMPSSASISGSRHSRVNPPAGAAPGRRSLAIDYHNAEVEGVLAEGKAVAVRGVSDGPAH